LLTLVTYLPFYRLLEIAEYFSKNIEIIKPYEAIVFVDNVYHKKQEEVLKLLPTGIKYVFGNWGSRNDTWITMFKELPRSYGIKGNVLFVDSDNILVEGFIKYHFSLRHYNVYGVLDYECWVEGANPFLERSVSESDKDSTFIYKVYEPRNYFRGGGPFFWGPKQAVYLASLPNEELVNKLGVAISHITPYLRNLVSDETLLGVMAWLLGINKVPWVVASHHFHHGSGRSADEFLVARAHTQFAQGLWRVFKKREFLAYCLKYKAILLRESIKSLIH
jgi:hypothetical protein